MFEFLDATTIFISFFSGFLRGAIELFTAPALFPLLVLGVAEFFLKGRHRF